MFKFTVCYIVAQFSCNQNCQPSFFNFPLVVSIAQERLFQFDNLIETLSEVNMYLDLGITGAGE
jgi:hypothetical protein